VVYCLLPSSQPHSPYNLPFLSLWKLQATVFWNKLYSFLTLQIKMHNWHNRPLSGRSVEWTLIPPPTMQIKKKKCAILRKSQKKLLSHNIFSHRREPLSIAAVKPWQIAAAVFMDKILKWWYLCYDAFPPFVTAHVVAFLEPYSTNTETATFAMNCRLYYFCTCTILFVSKTLIYYI
jgi:hypothetical protein